MYVHLLGMAQYVERHTELRRVLDMTDGISMVFARAQAVRRDWFRVVNAIEWGLVRRYEPEIVRRFNATVLIADVDDVRPFVERWALSLCPVRVAGHTAEFAMLPVELMRDAVLRRELGRRGVEFIAQSYDWDWQVAALESVLVGG